MNITRTTTWNLPGPSGTRDCINIVNLSHPSKNKTWQISFLGYSHFIQVNYLWIAFVITFISCMIKLSHLINIAMELWRLRYQDKFLPNMLFFLLRSLRNSSGILLGSRARLDLLVARFLRWYKVSFDKYSLWFTINFTMEDSLNVDSFDKSLLSSISFTMEGSLVIARKFVSPNIHS